AELTRLERLDPHRTGDFLSGGERERAAALQIPLGERERAIADDLGEEEIPEWVHQLRVELVARLRKLEPAARRPARLEEELPVEAPFLRERSEAVEVRERIGYARRSLVAGEDRRPPERRATRCDVRLADEVVEEVARPDHRVAEAIRGRGELDGD